MRAGYGGTQVWWMNRRNGFSHKPNLRLELLDRSALQLILVFINCHMALACGLK
jgi:hypothetical protein